MSNALQERDEALDTLNIFLAMRGFYLKESGRFLQLVPSSQIPQMDVAIFRGLDQVDEATVRPGEIVTVVLPLKFMDAAAAAKSVVRMVSTFGSSSGRILLATMNPLSEISS